MVGTRREQQDGATSEGCQAHLMCSRAKTSHSPSVLYRLYFSPAPGLHLFERTGRLVDKERGVHWPLQHPNVLPSRSSYCPTRAVLLATCTIYLHAAGPQSAGSNRRADQGRAEQSRAKGSRNEGNLDFAFVHTYYTYRTTHIIVLYPFSS